MLKGDALLFIFITVTLDSIGLGIIIPVLPDLLKQVMDAGIDEAAKWGGGLIRIAIPRYGEAKTALFSYVITIIALVFYGFVESSLLVYLTMPLAGLGVMVTPSISGILSNAVPEDEQGMLQGVLSGLAAIATIVSPLFLTHLFYQFSEQANDRLYLPGAPFFAAALFISCSLIAFIVGVKKAGKVDSHLDRAN